MSNYKAAANLMNNYPTAWVLTDFCLVTYEHEFEKQSSMDKPHFLPSTKLIQTTFSDGGIPKLGLRNTKENKSYFGIKKRVFITVFILCYKRGSMTPLLTLRSYT